MPTRRDLLKAGATLAVAANFTAAEAAPDAFRIQRLSWAGVKIQYRDTTLFLDPFLNAAIWEGAWKLPLIPMEVSTPTRFVLVTHVHNDHFDPVAIKEIGKEAGVTVVCHESKATYVSSRGFRVYPVPSYEPVFLGDLTATPIPAVDGLNEFQVSWVISDGARRILHGGDTLWHGGFWQIGTQHGPIDAAFLPINGARMLGRKPVSDVEATMTPAHAVAAAVVMRAKLLLPIHYGFHDPANYLEHPDCVEEMKRIAARRNQPYRVLEPGEAMAL